MISSAVSPCDDVALRPTPVQNDSPARADALIRASDAILAGLATGTAIDARMLRSAMEGAFGGSDAEGLWTWKDAYEAGEIALVLFLRRFGPAMRTRPVSAQLAMLAKVAGLLPTHTRRSEESQALQQFSTPAPLGFAAATAARIAPDDLVLEPSAGTGLLAVFGELADASLVLNELGDTRAGLLERLYPGAPVTRFDAARIHDHLNADVRPSVVLMNPPFSVAANVDGRVADAAYRHIASALARLVEGGRLVAITGASFSPDNAAWASAFARLQERGRIVFSAAIDGRVYARHGTTTDTRLTVIDRVPAARPDSVATSRGIAPDAATLLAWVEADVPARQPIAGSDRPQVAAASQHRTGRWQPRPASRPLVPVPADASELVYDHVEPSSPGEGRINDTLYEPFELQSVRIPGATPHPDMLVQSAAMASVRPPRPTYRPHLPSGFVEAGLASEAQLETLILAGV